MIFDMTKRVSGGGGYSISCVFTQSTNRIFTTDTLDVLRQYLVVTAHYSDNTSEAITDYSLSGTLTAGTSTITVTALDLSTTFQVTVTSATDVTPAANRWVAGQGVTFTINQTDNSILVFNAANGTYRNIQINDFAFDDGMRYRVTGHVTWFAGQGRIGFANSSGAIGGPVSYNSGTNSEDFTLDCCPSEDMTNYTQTGQFKLFCTWSTSTQGRILYSNVKVIEYSDADPDDLLNILLGDESA